MISLRSYRFFGKEISFENVLTGLVVIFLSLHMFTMPFVVYPGLSDTGPTWTGLDVSWEMTINYAKDHHLSWGKDIIFSYGPLGFLSTRIGWGIPRGLFILFDLFTVINFFFMFRDFIRKAHDKFLATIILIVISLLCNPFYGSDLSWVLLIFTFYWMYKAHMQPKTEIFIWIALLTGFSFYIKLNTALISLILYCGFLFNSFLFERISLFKAGLWLGITIAWLVFLSLLLHVCLTGYLAGSIEMIRGYNDIMHLEQEQKQTETNLRLLFWLIIFLYFAFTYFLIRRKKKEELFFVLIALIYVFLLKKQSVVRNDSQHLREFFSYSALVFLTGNLLLFDDKMRRWFLPGMTVITLLLIFLREDQRTFTQLVSGRFDHKKTYWEHIKYYKPSFYLSQPDKRKIPSASLARIGNGTIDVFPWDGEYLLENKLNYTPRPVFQSYTAYTAWLEKKNYDFYVKKPPEFVLYDYDAIDGRYPFNDETLVNLYLARNYSVADTFTSNERWRLLLQRKITTAAITWNKMKEERMTFSAEIPVNGAAAMKIFVKPNLRGKWLSFRYKPALLEIQFMNTNGEWRSFRTSPELLKSGIMTERLIYNTMDFAKYISQKDSLSPVVKIKLQGDARYLSSKIKVEYYKLE